jgi:hypothetical protein
VPGVVEGADELPEFDPELELLTLVVAVPAENGFADPEPHPTVEAITTAATLNWIETLDKNCTLNPRQPKRATD